ncbi:hypothetical protein HYU13_06390 [Candidatus Woesearchaeota archaeon]|nr:hypothetical protein [Candidatus Woesearchaeota archaeon]
MARIFQNIAHIFKTRELRYTFLDMSVPVAYQVLYFPTLYLINRHWYDPYPQQSLDFRLAGIGAVFGMSTVSFVWGKKPRLEFLAAMAPAILGSIDEYADFFHKLLGAPPNIRDERDIIAYFSGALLSYAGIKLTKKGLQALKNRGENPSRSLEEELHTVRLFESTFLKGFGNLLDRQGHMRTYLEFIELQKRGTAIPYQRLQKTRDRVLSALEILNRWYASIPSDELAGRSEFSEVREIAGTLLPQLTDTINQFFESPSHELLARAGGLIEAAGKNSRQYSCKFKAAVDRLRMHAGYEGYIPIGTNKQGKQVSLGVYFDNLSPIGKQPS